LKNTYLDYKVFAVSDSSEIKEKLSGKHQKQILIVYLDEKNPDMDAFLSKILSAVKIQLETDCLILKVEDVFNLPSFSLIKSLHTLKEVLVFGIKPKDLGLHFEAPQYLITEMSDHKFLFVDSLSVIFNTTERKKALWECLQILFK
jgi:hypothetical protein